MFVEMQKMNKQAWISNAFAPKKNLILFSNLKVALYAFIE